MKEIKMPKRNETVTLTFSQFWEIEQLLKREIGELEQFYKDAESDGDEYGKQVFKSRLSSLKNTLNALSKWGGFAE